MLARWFLVMVLLISPLQGALAAVSSWCGEIAPAGVDPCGSVCCPLCVELPACPCDARRDDRPADRQREMPRAGVESPRVAPAPDMFAAFVPERAGVFVRPVRAQAAGRLEATVNAFLSVVCVRTT